MVKQAFSESLTLINLYAIRHVCSPPPAQSADIYICRLGHMNAKEVFLQTCGTPYVCRKILNLNKNILWGVKLSPPPIFKKALPAHVQMTHVPLELGVATSLPGSGNGRCLDYRLAQPQQQQQMPGEAPGLAKAAGHSRSSSGPGCHGRACQLLLQTRLLWQSTPGTAPGPTAWWRAPRPAMAEWLPGTATLTVRCKVDGGT